MAIAKIVMGGLIRRNVSNGILVFLKRLLEMSVRNWLAGQPFEVQLDFGTQVLRSFGVTK